MDLGVCENSGASALIGGAVLPIPPTFLVGSMPGAPKLTTAQFFGNKTSTDPVSTFMSDLRGPRGRPPMSILIDSRKIAN